MTAVIPSIVKTIKTIPVKAKPTIAKPQDKLPVDVAAVERNLKDFQRDTVDYVFKRMYLDADPALRFLIADEVGLGKTMVARGVIARAIEHMWDTVKQIDVIYICSNADIARQNIARLNVTGQKDITFTSRITLLPLERKEQNKENRINFISFTPNTSFDLKSNIGRAEERALLFLLLKKAWNLKEDDTVLSVLQGQKDYYRFRKLVDDIKSRKIDVSTSTHFANLLEERKTQDVLSGKPTLNQRFNELRKKIGKTKSHTGVNQENAWLRNQLIGELRGVLARACLGVLEPDIIILDEFQRFKHLVTTDGESEASQLAQALFDYQDKHNNAIKARVLLLSATPYKMYTLEDEGGDENHYQDFLATLKFLLASPEKARVLEDLLDQYRRELLQLPMQLSSGANSDGKGDKVLTTVKRKLEAELRRVMVRTERLAVSEDRNGMLVEVPCTSTRLNTGDLDSYLLLQNIAEVIDHPETLEYWKSTPYALNFMEDYQLKKKFKDSLTDPLKNTALVKLVDTYRERFLSQDEIKQYKKIDPANARLRGLLADTVEKGVWQLLWMPPSMPYYRLSGAYAQPGMDKFTKRLVFSSWRVVPKAIATLVSYEVEQQMMHSFEGNSNSENTPEARRKRRPLLRFARGADGRETGMPVLGLLYPSLTLARECDPLKFGLEFNKANAGELLDYEAIISCAEEKVRQLLKKIGVTPGVDNNKKEKSRVADEAWYWAAPILLDLYYHGEVTKAWIKNSNLAKTWADERSLESVNEEGEEDIEEVTRWAEHVKRAADLVQTGENGLGRPPEDLARVVAKLAVAGPGTTALRALSRLSDTGFELRLSDATGLLDNAASLAWGFRHLFNQPETMAMLRGEMEGEKSYWQKVLDYCVQGCLQSVLDEYTHFLREFLGMVDKEFSETTREIATAVRNALSLRTSALRVDEISTELSFTNNEERMVQNSNSFRMRTNFAMRFGDEKQEEMGQKVTRADQVREAFNSPFWPFVLVTTSVGQEGLDFHPYCHAVVHWNLPSNPVDLEQREGRVHRYKGHAVRKNLAAIYGLKSIKDAKGDPWQKLFEQGKRNRPKNETDLMPYWILPLKDGARIERHVPALPLSQDQRRLGKLRRSLAVYRMVFGQNRQEDLVSYLLGKVSEEQLAILIERLVINLEPPRKLSKK
jgi:hypothetical protein